MNRVCPVLHDSAKILLPSVNRSRIASFYRTVVNLKSRGRENCSLPEL